MVLNYRPDLAGQCRTGTYRRGIAICCHYCARTSMKLLLRHMLDETGFYPATVCVRCPAIISIILCISCCRLALTVKYLPAESEPSIQRQFKLADRSGFGYLLIIAQTFAAYG
jgi:hypothetical protein